MTQITLIDARSTSLTVTWPAVEGAKRYILEFRTGSVNENDKGEEDAAEIEAEAETETVEFQTLSDKLMQTQARKRNLSPTQTYFFRVAGVVEDIPGEWITHEQPFSTLSAEDDEASMEAPKAANAGSNQALVISWQKSDAANDGYELQMRENQGGTEWNTIAASLSGTEVKKKNLASKAGYQFRVRPAKTEGPYSPPSETAVAKSLSAGIQRFFNSLDNGTLLRSGATAPVPLSEALGGKEFVLLYASAHWCPPCRQFTPMLANWYKQHRKQVEIVFLSCDHDEQGFRNYFATHPWMAVDYDDDARENLLGAIRVSGIPRLVVVSGDTGKVVEDNAVGKPLDIRRWRSMNK